MGTLGEAANADGLSRRDLIRRAVVVGGVVWSAPVVIDSLASPAAAASVCTSAVCSTTSPSNLCTWYGFRINASANSTTCQVFGGNLDKCPDVNDFWTYLQNNGFNPQNGCPPGTVISVSSGAQVSFTLPSTCNVAIGTVFAGNDCCYFGPDPGGSCTFTVGRCNGHDISHVDVIVCCC